MVKTNVDNYCVTEVSKTLISSTDNPEIGQRHCSPLPVGEQVNHVLLSRTNRTFAPVGAVPSGDEVVKETAFRLSEPEEET
jgi:hypothetical protein